MNYIVGKIVYKRNNYIIIENNFIGYKIFIANASQLEENRIYKIYINKKQSFHNNFFNEELYGFKDFKEKIFFEKILHVSGIGHKTAILILENDYKLIEQLIYSQDIEGLINLKGINKKIANALISEIEINESNFENKLNNKNCKTDVISVLKVLGYSKDEINTAISEVSEKDFFVSSENDISSIISQLIKRISFKNAEQI